MAIAFQSSPEAKGRPPTPYSQFRDVIALRDGWKAIFDPSSTKDEREGIVKGIRDFVDFGLIIKPRSPASQIHYLGYIDLEFHPHLSGESRIPQSTVVVAVMARGLNTAGYYYSQFREMGLCEGNLRMIGFSSGMYKHGSSKVFSDGTSMYGKVYALHEDLEAIMQGNSVTFVDHCTPVTRTTLVALGRALLQQGYSNPIFELDNNGHVKPWNNYVIRDPKITLPRRIPIITERGASDYKLLTAAKLAARA